MEYINIKTLHDDSLAQFKVGLMKATSFSVKNTGSTIEMTDDANTVNKLKIGNAQGFYITHNGSNLEFNDDSNAINGIKVGGSSGISLKDSGSTIELTNNNNSANKLKVGGSTGFTISLVGNHIVFSANSGSSPLCVSEPGRGGIPGCAYYYCHQDKYSGASASSLTDESSPVAAMSAENTTPVCILQAETKKDPLVTDIPNANEVPEGSLLMSSNGEWIPVNMSDLVAQITKNVMSQLKADQN